MWHKNLEMKSEDLKEELYYGSNAEGASNILKIGDFVRLRSGGAVGLLTGINKLTGIFFCSQLTVSNSEQSYFF